MARHTLAPRLGAAATTIALLGGLAACGGDDGDTNASDSSSNTSSSSDPSESTDSGSTEEASGDLEELSGEDFYKSMVEALKEAETANFEITTDSGQAGTSTMTGQMQYTDAGIEMSGKSTGAQPMEFVLLDKTMYISGAGLPLPDGKKWFKVDLSDPNSLFGQLGKSTDPESMFAAMENPKKFELVGEEDVDGVAANHYTITMDTAEYIKAMDMPAELGSMLPDEIVSDMWLDADDRPVKFAQDTELPNPSGKGAPIKTHTEGFYRDYGTDVSIEEPPAAEVADNIPGLG